MTDKIKIQIVPDVWIDRVKTMLMQNACARATLHHVYYKLLAFPAVIGRKPA